jgi:exopolysaccharide production protein ExoQ
MSSHASEIDKEPTIHPVGTRPEISVALWRAAIVTLAIMPIGMAIAHRSSPVFVGLAAALAVLAVASEGRFAEFAGKTRRILSTSLGMTTLAFLAWTAVSIGWSEFPLTSLRAWGEFWLSFAFAFVVAIALPGRLTRHAFWLLALTCALAALLMLVEMHSGMAWRRAMHVRSYAFIFNRPMLTLAMLLPAVAAFLMGRGRFGVLAAIGLAAFVAVAVGRSESGAALVGLSTAVTVFILGRLAPRLVTRVAAVAFIAVLGLAPFLGAIGEHLIPETVHQRLAEDHTRERIGVWLSFGDAIRQDPVLGGGFGVSPVMDRTSVAGKVPPEHRELLAVGHPHNAAIQIWAELGIVGVVLTLMIILQVLRIIARQQRIVAATSLALMAGATAVALVGHGAWQGWWAASLGAAIVWLLALRRTELERTR